MGVGRSKVYIILILILKYIYKYKYRYIYNLLYIWMYIYILIHIKLRCAWKPEGNSSAPHSEDDMKRLEITPSSKSLPSNHHLRYSHMFRNGTSTYTKTSKSNRNANNKKQSKTLRLTTNKKACKMQNKQQTESYVGRGFFLRFWDPGLPVRGSQRSMGGPY